MSLIRDSRQLCVIVFVAMLILSVTVPSLAQSTQPPPVEILHSFAPELAFPAPFGPLLQMDDGAFYGMAQWFGTQHKGAIYSLRQNANLQWERRILHTFDAPREGRRPWGGLIRGSDGQLYGMTTMLADSSADGNGAIFKITPDGAFTLLHVINSNTEGVEPYGGLVEASDGNFYATLSDGGAFGAGSIFRMTPSGDLTLIHSFDGASGGATPYGPLIQARDGYLYGTTFGGGTHPIWGAGVVFRVSLDGVFSVLHVWDPSVEHGRSNSGLVESRDGNLYGTHTNGVFRVSLDGTYTLLSTMQLTRDTGLSTLIEASDGELYGTATGGNIISGAVYRVSKSGVVTIIHRRQDEWEGSYLSSGVVEGHDGYLYGTALYGGVAAGSAIGNNPTSFGSGTIFRVARDGSNYQVIHAFDGSRGLVPIAPLTLASDGHFYGLTYAGGARVDVPGGRGAFYRMDQQGVVRTLHSLSFAVRDVPTWVEEGSHATAGLLEGPDHALYGTTSSTIIRLTLDGALSRLHLFTGSEATGWISPLIFGLDGALYGTTTHGGTHGYGTIFRITVDGDFATQHSFAGPEGAHPIGAIAQAPDGRLYVATAYGGAFGLGAIARVSAAGVTRVHSFDWTTGAIPFGGLVTSRTGVLYGTAFQGGAQGAGTIFRLTTSGSVTVVHSFDEPGHTGSPIGTLLETQAGELCGTTYPGLVYCLSSGGFRRAAKAEGAIFAGLVEAPEGGLYGTSALGGEAGYGFIFKVANGSR